MKKFLGLSAVVFLFSMCSTELDLLDDWTETTVVYGLLDQNQPKQYIRIQKAFLGPDNAFDMAQQYDSINYVTQLNVRMERLFGDGIDSVIYFQPDTVYNKQPGDFYAPMYVIYSYPQSSTWFSPSYRYRLVINNASTGHEVTSTTNVVESFDITYPAFGTIGFASNNVNYRVELRWEPARNAMLYQVVMRFHYTEVDIDSVYTPRQTSDYVLGEVMASSSQVSYESLKFHPDDFYRFVGGNIDENDNVVWRRCDSVRFYVYACGEELYNYIAINGPSSSLVQEKPQYTNIDKGLGVYSARTSTNNAYGLPNQSVDSLSRGRFTCHLKFRDHNGDNFGCQ